MGLARKPLSEGEIAVIAAALGANGGNVSAAARAAGVGKWRIDRWRGRDPRLAALFDEARDEGRAAARVLRAGKDGVQAVRVRRWTPRREAEALAAARATGSLAAAAEAVGYSPDGLRRRRRVYPAFGSAMGEAIEEGRVRLEAALIHNANAVMTGEALPPHEPGGVAIPTMTVSEAIAVVRLGREERAGRRRGRVPEAPGGMAGVSARIMAKLEALARADAIGAAEG